MTAPPPKTHRHGVARVPRRSVFVVMLGAATLAGCTLTPPRSSDPSPTPSDSSRPGPEISLPEAPAIAEIEWRLASVAADVAEASNDREPEQAELLRTISAGHRDHRDVLLGPEPASRTVGPNPPSASTGPGSGPTDTPAALAQLIKEQRELSDRLAKLAVGADGLDALLWASLSASARAYGRALKRTGSQAKPPARSRRGRVQPIAAEEARRAMIEQLHAINYGYQTAIGRLSGATRERSENALQRHRVLRDELIEGLVGAAVEVPAAAPAYELPIRPTNARAATQLIMTMETALLPFCGQWVSASAQRAERERAIGVLHSTTDSVIDWGGPLLTWPGYVEQ